MSARPALFALLLGASASSWGCGVCIEDRIAAVYDHAVVSRALGAKHQVAFFHVDGPLAADAGKSVAALAGSASGVDRGSARVSAQSRTLSVAFDPRRTSFAQLQGLLERKLAPKGFSLLPLKLMERPAEWADASR